MLPLSSVPRSLAGAILAGESNCLPEAAAVLPLVRRLDEGGDFGGATAGGATKGGSVTSGVEFGSVFS